MALPSELSNIFAIRSRTYQMVLILSLLELVDSENGLANLSEVKERFLSFYVRREREGLVVDAPPSAAQSWANVNVTRSTFNNVFRQPVDALDGILIGGSRDDLQIGFESTVWLKMTPEVIEELTEYGQRELNVDLSKMWSKSYFSLNGLFSVVMQNYLRSKQEPRGQHEVAHLLEKDAVQGIRALSFIDDRYIVKGSVGRPAWARMPWIAIMDKRVTESTPKGYYICYVFTEDMQSVYLTIKHSNQPIQELGAKKAGFDAMRERVNEIRQHFPVQRYHTDELVDLEREYKDWNYLVGVAAYKRYDRDNLPSDEELFTDLKQIVEDYKNYVDGTGETSLANTGEEDMGTTEIQTTVLTDDQIEITLSRIWSFITAKGFTYPTDLLENFYLSLKSKPFVILAGISGTGKTKLVQLFGNALGATEQNGQFTLIPVRPDWSDPSDLIGYTDLNGNFRKGELTNVLERAMQPQNRHLPFFICLDEMNLARVEHYFSDLLSILETQKWDEKRSEILTNKVVTLPGTDENDATDLHLPDNVYLIGTVNMDDTTHPFSKKVLDRANTIEFNYINLVDLDWLDAAASDSAQVLENIPNSFLRSDYLNLKDAIEHRDLIKDTSEKLVEINEILKHIHANVGYRVRDAICFYMAYNKRFDLMSDDTAFDFQIMQKILPRIQGSSQAVRDVLVRLLNYLPLEVGLTISPKHWDDDSQLLMKIIREWTDDDFTQKMRYPESARKIAYMLRRYEEDGFTSFWLS
jgi:5-methylcytosine-specific restriction enzyme B